MMSKRKHVTIHTARLASTRISGRISGHVMMSATGARVSWWRTSRVRRMSASSRVRWWCTWIARSAIGAWISWWSTTHLTGIRFVVGIVSWLLWIRWLSLLWIRITALGLVAAATLSLLAKAKTASHLGLSFHNVVRLMQLVVGLQFFGPIAITRVRNLRRDTVELANNVEYKKFAGHQKDEKTF